MRRLSVILGICVVVLTLGVANAQPFFGGGVVAYNPQISTVSSGVVIDAQPVVSYDRKYVNINMQAQNSSLLALRNFQVASGITGPAQGFVGGVTTSTTSFAPTDPGKSGPASESPDANSPGANSPEQIERRAIAARSILAQRGMFLLRVN
jgi:hypothetical protein